MSTFSASCVALLFTGLIGHHRATCCLGFGYEDSPPYNRAVFLTASGECRVRHFHRRRAVFGWDANGPIRLGLCQDITVYGFVDNPTPAPDVDCCLLAAVGSSTTGRGLTPTPRQIIGTVQCPTKRGMKTGPFTLSRR